MKQRRIQRYCIISMAFIMLLSVFAQDLAYLLDEYLLHWHPLYYLTVITIGIGVLWISMYIVHFVLLFLQKIDPKNLFFHLLFISLISLPFVGWDIFVLAMWWG